MADGPTTERSKDPANVSPALAVIGSLGAAIAAALASDAVPPLAAGLATMALAFALVALVLWVIRRP